MKEIPLTKGKFAIVDDEDFERLCNYKWVISDGYAVTSFRNENGEYKQNLRMHRMILDVQEGKVIDHINGDRIDNRKENLRIATQKQNSWNSKKKDSEKATSKYKGVSVSSGKFIVKIKHDGKKEHVGTFNDEIAAANAYNYYAVKYFGEYARLNSVPVMTKEEFELHKSKTSSIYKGVSWAKDIRKWAVQIYDNETKKQEFVGYFEDEIVAANYFNHLMKQEINKCRFVSIEECEKRKHIRKVTSKFRGVSWEKTKSRWEVNVWNGNKKHFVGYFTSEIEAAKAWNEKATELNVKDLERKLNVIKEEVDGE
jgi:hypothetical protein